MSTYRSHSVTKGRNMAGARSLWRATGMKEALETWDLKRNPSAEVLKFFQAGPAGIPTQTSL